MSSNDVRGALPSCTSDDAVKYTVIAAFAAVAWYNCIELNVQVFLTFKRHRGLYFWSLIVASWGIALHALGFILKFFVEGTPWELYSVIIMLGWWAMVTGQSIVLWSRLHLVVRDNRLLRAVLAMICIDAICLHIPTSVLTWGSYSPNPAPFQSKFEIVEKVQMTVFVVQETIISVLYVWATLRLLKPIYHGRTRKVLVHLVVINVVIICMDAVLLGMEYSDHYEIQASLKPMVYSIKLKLEFAVLNQLMVLANTGLTDAARSQHNQKGRNGSSSTAGGIDESWDPTAAKEKSADYQKPSKQDAWDHRQADKGMNANPGGRKKWIPSLDRNAIVKVSDFEVRSEDKTAVGSAQQPGGKATKPAAKSLMGTTVVGMPKNAAKPRSSVEHLNRDPSPTDSETRLNPFSKIRDAGEDMNIAMDGHEDGILGTASAARGRSDEEESSVTRQLNENAHRGSQRPSTDAQRPASRKKSAFPTQEKAHEVMGTGPSGSGPRISPSRARNVDTQDHARAAGSETAGLTSSASSGAASSETRVAPSDSAVQIPAAADPFSHAAWPVPGGQKGERTAAAAAAPDSLGTNTHISAAPTVSMSAPAKKIRNAAHNTAKYMTAHPLTHEDGRPRGTGADDEDAYDPGQLDPYDNFVGAGVGAGSKMGDRAVGPQPPGIPADQNVLRRPRPIAAGEEHRHSVENIIGGGGGNDDDDVDFDDQLMDDFGMKKRPNRDEETGRY
ncbi:MAG: hypothetical protein M1825_004489 [Sarcosagium campestre]|nr:MAG: hypothetical protein M1825_004489 [Sarcosagium campestre]